MLLNVCSFQEDMDIMEKIYGKHSKNSVSIKGMYTHDVHDCVPTGMCSTGKVIISAQEDF